ncbi:MAG: DUF4350 domain-containing protein [Armatimonadota bacterium]|jgi:hypothetical protein
MRPSKDAWFLIGVFVMLVVLMALFSTRQPRSTSTVSTSYSTNEYGVKAFYTLLGERLGYNVARLHDPYNQLPADSKVLLVIQPLDEHPIAPEETAALQRWVNDGGVVVFLASSTKQLPAGFKTNRSIGKGQVYVRLTKDLLTNKSLADYRRALPVLDLISAHARPNTANDLILFDEYHHGLQRSKPIAFIGFFPQQIRIAAVIIAVALIALGYGQARRFGAVRGLPESNSRRPEFEYVESVARLYERAGASDLAADILLQSFRQRLCRSFGLNSDSDSRAIVERLQNRLDKQTATSIKRLLDSDKSGTELTQPELLSMARQIHALETKLLKGN